MAIATTIAATAITPRSNVETPSVMLPRLAALSGLNRSKSELGARAEALKYWETWEANSATQNAGISQTRGPATKRSEAMIR